MPGAVEEQKYLASQPPERRVPDALEEIRARVDAVIFAGNVGEPDSLAKVIRILRED